MCLEGSSGVVAYSSTATCPVSAMEGYFKKAALDDMTTKFVFCSITQVQNGQMFKTVRPPQLYTRAWELMNQKLFSLRNNAADFDMHSFRPD